MNLQYRETLKKIIELRAKEQSRTTSRSINDALKIAELARILFEKHFEVISWKREERILRMRI